MAVDSGSVHAAADLVRRFGTGPPENLGEAEVVAACKRYGWTAVIEDEAGRRAARDHGVAHVSSATLLAAATAYDKLTPTQAWKLHAKMHQRDRVSWLKPDAGQKPVFVTFAGTLRALRLRRGDPAWPLLLAEPLLDALLIELIRRGP